MAAVRPQWTAVRSARDALGLEGRVLLHAGPPLQDPTRPPTPMLNSAVLSCLHEGWARTPEEAERLLAGRMVRLEPSYTRSVATPLVAMVSPKTTLAEISDGERRYYAFLGTGAGPQQRFGTRDPAILERLAFRETILAPGFTELLDAPVDLLSLARAAIREGDELHNRLSSATTLLHAALPGQWFTAPSPLVKGPFMKGSPPNPEFGPATGDSGVIDAFGLGGQGLRHSPSLLNAFSCWMEAKDDERARSMLADVHPILETRFALDATAVAKSARSPNLSTGMVSADGRGLLGRGLCAVPVDVFVKAVGARSG